jgi:ATP-binding cassette subfamily B protein
MLPGVAMVVVLVVGGARVQSGALEIGDLITFLLYIYELTFPTFIMGWAVALVQRGAAAMQRLDEILSTEPTIADREDAVSVDTLRGEIEFRHLTFSYGDGRRAPALRDVSVTVPAGSTLGVVGPVGSGKTTLASLIPRLLEVGDGHVFVDGIDVNHVRLESLRRNIAMVPQDSFLFSMSLADNIAYGLEEVDREAVRQASQRAQLGKDLDDLPAGFETLVGERGVMLSGGQRQRTALARALALKPGILILDDTLSAVDAETETEIQQSLREVFGGRTVIVVANRLSSVQECDQIVVLDEGRVVERGSHTQLLALDGLYARLAREQAEQPDSGERPGMGEVA